MEKKIKVAMVTNHFGITGISTVILNYCSELNHEKYDLTIIAGEPISEDNKNKCQLNGIEMIALPARHGRALRHYFLLWKELRKGRYDIVHVHGSSSMMAIELTIARIAGIRTRIAHSHNSKCPNMKVHKLLNPYFKKTYTYALACGNLAGDWLFGKDKFSVMPNGFKTVEYSYNPSKREQVRKELNIEDKIVIGHVGRVNEQKNQEYLLKVFEKVAFNHPEMQLLIVGTGPDFNKIQNLISSHPYRSQIILFGESDNPAALYSAMDIFVLPSLYEGLPVVLLEAQISGLPCIVSDTVTREVDFGDIVWKSIASNPSKWSEAILNISKRSQEEREAYFDKHRGQIDTYDIGQDVIILDQLYSRLYRKKR